MGASRQNDRRGFCDAQFRKGLAKIPANAAVFPFVVEFYAARAEDSPRIDAQGLPALCVGGFLNAKEVELIKYRRCKRTDHPIAGLRAAGEPRVDERESGTAGFRLSREVGPHFCFDEKKAPRPNQANGTPRSPEKINRVVDCFEVFALLPARQCEAGRSGRGKHDGKLRIAVLHLTNEFQGDQYFADTHRVNPSPSSA